MIGDWTHYLEEVGSSHTPGYIFSIYLKEELNPMENNNNNKNKKYGQCWSGVCGKIGLLRTFFAIKVSKPQQLS